MDAKDHIPDLTAYQWVSMDIACKTFIGGEYVYVVDGQTSDIVNSANGKIFTKVAKCGLPDLHRAVNRVPEH